jgi:hypothetical protein
MFIKSCYFHVFIFITRFDEHAWIIKIKTWK